MAFNNNTGSQSFTAAAGQTDFTFNFKIYNETDLKVYQTLSGVTPDDTTDILTYITDYTVTINGDDGGTVALVTGATVGDTIVIERELPQTRSTSYVTNGDLKADTINLDQDYQTYLIQDANTTVDNAIQLPRSAVGINPVIQAATPGYYLKFTDDGTGVESTPASSTGGGQFLGDNDIVKGVQYMNQTTISTITVGAGFNAFSIDSLVIADGASITVENGAVYKIL